MVTVTYDADKATTQKMEEDLKEAKYPTAPYSINDVVEKSVAYKADDIHCGGRAAKVKKNLGAVEGIDSVGVDLKAKLAELGVKVKE